MVEVRVAVMAAGAREEVTLTSMCVCDVRESDECPRSAGPWEQLFYVGTTLPRNLFAGFAAGFAGFAARGEGTVEPILIIVASHRI